MTGGFPQVGGWWATCGSSPMGCAAILLHSEERGEKAINRRRDGASGIPALPPKFDRGGGCCYDIYPVCAARTWLFRGGRRTSNLTTDLEASKLSLLELHPGRGTSRLPAGAAILLPDRQGCPAKQEAGASSANGDDYNRNRKYSRPTSLALGNVRRMKG